MTILRRYWWTTALAVGVGVTTVLVVVYRQYDWIIAYPILIAGAWIDWRRQAP